MPFALSPPWSQRKRAERLVSRRHRHVLASGLRRVVATAERPSRSISSAAPIRRGQVLEARARLLEVAALLDGDEGLDARGIALVEDLLTDSASPIYSPARPGELDGSLRHARAALLLER